MEIRIRQSVLRGGEDLQTNQVYDTDSLGMSDAEAHALIARGVAEEAKKGGKRKLREEE